MKTLAGSNFSALLLLGNDLSNGRCKWKTASISNSNIQAKTSVKTPHSDIPVSSLLQLSLLRAGSLHGKWVGLALSSPALASCSPLPSSQAWTGAWLEVKAALSPARRCLLSLALLLCAHLRLAPQALSLTSSLLLLGFLPPQ